MAARGLKIGLLVLTWGSLRCAPAAQLPRGPHAERAVVGACGVDEPQRLPWGQSVTSSTEQGRDRLTASCVRAQARECLYRLDVPARADVRIALLSMSFDGALSLHRLEEEGELACIDDTPLGDTHHARLELTLDPGSYLLVVDGSDGGAGPFELFAELDPLPAPELLCSQAQPLAEGMYTRGSTRGAANVFAARCGSPNSGPDFVYALPLAAPSRVRLREQSEFDAVLSLRQPCAPGAPDLLCSDESPMGAALVTAELPAGAYAVVVDGYGPRDGGDYVLAYERAAVPPAVSLEQACAAGTALATPTTQVEVDTFYAPSALAGSCGGAGAPEQLFRLTLTERKHVQLALSQREFDPVVYVLRACDTASELACGLLATPTRRSEERGPEPVLSLDLAAGEYLVVVDGQAPADMGAATFHVTLSPALSAGPRAP